MCQVTTKSKVARIIYTRPKVVGLKAGETGCGQIRRAWTLSAR